MIINLFVRALNAAIVFCHFVCDRVKIIGQYLILGLAVGILLSQSVIMGPTAVMAASQAFSDFPDLDRSEPQRSSILSADDVSSEKLSAFVTAYVAVMDVVERQEIPWQNAESESEALRLQQEVEEEAIAKIEASGLSQAEYLQLLNLIQVDTELGETIASLLQDYD
ncbi:MAG: DUF4168 domain-containing protein [Cyanobacteria bacterium]|nr:DUF4168 domain-containing protein [Cyanobacteriota bacterium]